MAKKPAKSKSQASSLVPFRDHNGNVSPSADFPENVEGLLQDGYLHTHTAQNGNRLFTRNHAKHGYVYAEVDNEGKVVEVRTIPHV